MILDLFHDTVSSAYRKLNHPPLPFEIHYHSHIQLILAYITSAVDTPSVSFKFQDSANKVYVENGCLLYSRNTDYENEIPNFFIFS